jgi:CO dehydrogenase/acetyl-CoA synthase gamma subunit (corrinoid Fe-S protein)
MDYKVEPGLYAVGTPDDKAPVLVTANYKMTFDRLREQLGGVSLWIVVLDTDGVNVWCAAGKGTFGTDEVVHRVKEVGLDRLVSHRTLLLPQLSATGVAAHEVKKQTGFRVVYGPIKAKDISNNSMF